MKQCNTDVKQTSNCTTLNYTMSQVTLFNKMTQ